MTTLPRHLLALASSLIMGMFEPFYLFIAIMMGLVGIGALRHGKTTGSIRHIAIGVLMMVVPYFIIEAKLLALTGSGLTILLFWP